jgi:MHS family proline/betaine transporter-like MFS transporter
MAALGRPLIVTRMARLSAVLARSLDVAQLDSWGWRIPFLFGGALAGAVWIARNCIVETPLFDGPPVGAPGMIGPLRYLLRNEARGIALGFAISALGSVTYCSNQQPTSRQSRSPPPQGT